MCYRLFILLQILGALGKYLGWGLDTVCSVLNVSYCLKLYFCPPLTIKSGSLWLIPSQNLSIVAITGSAAAFAGLDAPAVAAASWAASVLLISAIICCGCIASICGYCITCTGTGCVIIYGVNICGSICIDAIMFVCWNAGFCYCC